MTSVPADPLPQHDDPFSRFFLPGPIAVHPAVMHAMLRSMESHRSAEMSARVHAMQPMLGEVFGTTRPVIIATAAATGLKEMAMRCLVQERVLVVVGGLFAERFVAIAERCGKQVVKATVPYDRPITPDELRAALLAHPDIDAVALVHSETGTGVLAPLEALAQVVHEVAPETMLIVDGVTSVGAMPMEADRWGLDFVLTGSQKGLGLPPGLSLAVASARAVARAKTVPARGWYFDLVLAQRNAESDTFPQTPALPLLNALEVQLERIRHETVQARYARHAALRACVDAWSARTGWALVPAVGDRSWTVSAVQLQSSVSAARVVQTMAERGWTITDGLPPTADRQVRVGHMGDVTPAHLVGVLDALDAVLREHHGAA